MEKQKKILLIIILFSIFLITTMASTYLLSPSPELNPFNGEEKIIQPESTENNQDQIESKAVLLGSREYGNVKREGPFGDSSSPTKIAYIIGVHPNEHNSHQAILEAIKSNQNNLRYCYYVYQVQVTKDAADYSRGRMNGQLLAQEFVVSDIKKTDFKLAIDIHSHQGAYEEERFIFAPVEGGAAEKIARDIKNKIPWMVYYFPFSQTSPEYVTIPIENAGIPVVIYETYLYEPYSLTRSHADVFVKQVDTLAF